jgi:5'-nucleotidase
VPRRFLAIAALAAAALVPACSSSDDTAEPPATNPTTTAPRTSTSATGAPPLRVLVTNDDGVDAPGIDALVEALRKLPDTTVTVVAPAKNQSGTGSQTTTGPPPAVTDATTASGYPAKAVDGFPADTIVWAIDRNGVATRPDVVLSGVNFGQNIGLTVDISGTVGAARAAAQRGIPALAVSAGLAENPAYELGAQQAVAWLTKHRAKLRDARATVTNLNIPTCPSGSPRKLVVVPVAGEDENPIADVTCTGTAPAPTTDVGSFLDGYIVQTNNLPLRPAA